MYYPITCVDNFYTRPDEVREFALSLDYEKESVSYPGKRTKHLHLINPDFFDVFCRKFMSLFHDFEANQNVTWEIDTQFQIIEPDEIHTINEGWIHRDPGILSGVIYLTPDIPLDYGTSFYRPKKEYRYAKIINCDHKDEYYFSQNKNLNVDFYQQKLRENNDRFEQVAKFSNIYNRLITFSGGYYHKEDKLYTKNTSPRLTQFFCVRKVGSSYFPIPASRRPDIA